MEDFFNALISSNGIALIVASIIFIVTVVLVVKRLIGFVFTLILLFFAIVSGFVIANNEIVREYIRKEPSQPGQHNELSVEAIKDQFRQALNQLKAEMCTIKEAEAKESEKKVTERFQSIWNKLESHERHLEAALEKGQTSADSALRSPKKSETDSR